MSELSLETAYIFYATYHHDEINKWIHILCIWPIFISGIVLLYLLSPLVALLICLMYASYYAIVEQPGIVGCVGSVLVCASYFFAFWLYFQYHLDSTHTIIFRGAAAIHVCGWLAQFYGHAFHEGRAPALLTNLYQALMMAPLFVLLEVFFMFGYKPEFQARTEPIIAAKVKAFKKEQKKKSS